MGHSKGRAAVMKVHGSCHCGAVRYEAEVDPAKVSICHCTDCQKLTGSAYRVSVGTTRDRFRLLAGSPTTYVKTAESGAQRAQVFCGRCGSPMWTYDVADDAKIGLRVGGIDERAQLSPARQIWCRSALGWAQDLSGLPRFEKEAAAK